MAGALLRILTAPHATAVTCLGPEDHRDAGDVDRLGALDGCERPVRGGRHPPRNGLFECGYVPETRVDPYSDGTDRAGR